ncbi:MAG: alpha/beta hydrolase [Rhodospirillaceae bacterium]|nr:alpha/beta hydrolase [Rhodospirillaceae bacterium]MBT5040600.1 alpha/beta hydrolase [Rhodospirillaceae bacterium]MBT5675337.1 alpha/beta hydrolase [Rhodospirillaceae bacterium]MBT7291172.1 alpha/beta hydrolase [Rhodospirillaceae bacterium]
MAKICINEDLEMAYEESGAGNGRPIIFIHGVWMSARFFHKQLPDLGTTNHTIALDLRGHGASSHVSEGHTMPTYAADVRAFIKAKGLKDVVLVGWSMGCMVIWDYFKQFGDENIAGTILVEQTPADFKWPDWDQGLFDLPALIHMMSEVQTGREAIFRGFVPMMFKTPPPQDEIDWMVAENMRIPPTIASAVLFDQTVQDYRADLAKVTAPTLVICGNAENKLLPTPAVKFVHEHIPGSSFSLYEDSSHCPFLEETERFNREVEAFVRALG